MIIVKLDMRNFSANLPTLFTKVSPQRRLKALGMDVWELVVVPWLWYTFFVRITNHSFESIPQLFIHISLTCILLCQFVGLRIGMICARVLLSLDSRESLNDFFPRIYCRGNTECAAWSLGLILGFKHQNRSNDIFGNTVAAY
jgi:hypothetical protein